MPGLAAICFAGAAGIRSIIIFTMVCIISRRFPIIGGPEPMLPVIPGKPFMVPMPALDMFSIMAIPSCLN